MAAGTQFGLALEWVKNGKKAMRKGWGGTGEHIKIVKPSADNVLLMPYIIKVEKGNRYYPWAPTQEDLLAEDWVVAVK